MKRISHPSLKKEVLGSYISTRTEQIKLYLIDNLAYLQMQDIGLHGLLETVPQP